MLASPAAERQAERIAFQQESLQVSRPYQDKLIHSGSSSRWLSVPGGQGTGSSINAIHLFMSAQGNGRTAARTTSEGMLY